MSSSPETRRREKKKRKKINVDVEIISKSADSVAPVVGYFPSGYNPDAPDVDPPGIRLFRNKHHPNRVELVVSPPGANVEFVGSNYSGEAAAPQLCSYALGVLDKDTRTLKIVPIASNKILRLEPRLIKGTAANREAEEGEGEEGVSVERKMKDLTKRFGTKKNRNQDNIWSSLNQQKNDPSTRESLDLKVTNPDINNESAQAAKGTVTRNIPPFDSSAVVPEKAYLLEEIILNAEWQHLVDILEYLQSGCATKSTFWQENDYPSFVINRIHKLMEIQDIEEKEKQAGILSFISHLVKFWNLGKDCRRSASMFQSTSHRKPRIIYQRLVMMFVDPVTCVISTEQKELLIGYILVLTLFADNFLTDPSDIAKDMGMTRESLLPYFAQLGCKSVAPEGTFFKTLVKLPVPLVFREVKKRNNRRRR